MPIPQTIEGREYTAFTECNGLTAKRTSICQAPGETVKVEFAQSGISTNIYGETLALAGLGTSDVINYTVPVGKVFTLKSAEFSGENKGVFSILINSVVEAKKRTWFVSFNGDFYFSDLILSAGDNIKLNVQNESNSIADFNGNIQGKLDDA